MGLYWTGTGFEEREVQLPSPQADSPTPEPQQTAQIRGTSEETSSWELAGKKLRSTQDQVHQKVAQETGSDYPSQPGTNDGESRKKIDGGGLERYDPALGVWVREQEAPPLSPIPELPSDSDPVVPPPAVAVDRPPQKATGENSTKFKWTSWFRTELKDGRLSVAPSPKEAPGAAAQEPTLPDAAILAVYTNTSRDASSSTASQDKMAPDAESAPADEMASRNTATLDVQIADVDDTSVLAPDSSLPVETPGELMWQSAADEGEPISRATPSAGEKSQALLDGIPPRWFVLKRMLGGSPAVEYSISEPAGNVPVLEVFSLAGGVGKTSFVATLGRALSAREERVLLVETTPVASLQYFFGACDCRPGLLRTFRPPRSSNNAPIRLASADPDVQTAESAVQGSLAIDIQRWAQGASRVIVDVRTGSAATVRALSKMSPLVLVPLIPDVNSVVTVNSIDSFFQRHAGPSDDESNVFYVLNQFDSSLPLHDDVRNMLRERLGERLLPFVLERIPAVSEALAEGMTIMDYAPDSKAAATFTCLARSLQHVQAPAAVSAPGRWSEQ